ncbi:hypothetical protein V6Z11_A13G078400 [Gossypium hirsutum]
MVVNATRLCAKPCGRPYESHGLVSSCVVTF